MTGSASLGFLDHPVSSGSHICAFFSGPEGRDALVMPFLAGGLRAQQKCICIPGSLSPADVLAGLGEQVDLDRPAEPGQLDLGTPADTYLRRGEFSTEDMLDYWHQFASLLHRAGPIRE